MGFLFANCKEKKAVSLRSNKIKYVLNKKKNTILHTFIVCYIGCLTKFVYKLLGIYLACLKADIFSYKFLKSIIKITLSMKSHTSFENEWKSWISTPCFQSQKRIEYNVAITGIIFPSIIEQERIYGCHFWLSITESERMYYHRHCHYLPFNYKKWKKVSLPSSLSEKKNEYMAALFCLSIRENVRMYCCHHCHYFSFNHGTKKKCIGAITAISVIFCLSIV